MLPFELRLLFTSRCLVVENQIWKGIKLYYSTYYKFSNYQKECLVDGKIYFGWNSNQEALLKVEKDDEIFVFTGINNGPAYLE